MNYDDENLTAQEIILACTSGIRELEAIQDYSRKLIDTKSGEMKAIYKDNRRDELPHIQNLVIAITAMVGGESPQLAVDMDAQKDF